MKQDRQPLDYKYQMVNDFYGIILQLIVLMMKSRKFSVRAKPAASIVIGFGGTYSKRCVLRLSD
jgi:hypothetical protein